MKEINVYLRVGSHIKIDDRVYFMNLSFNSVFYLDLNDFSVHFVHTFSFASASAIALSCSGCMFDKNVIYFFPNNTNIIMEYDIVEKKERMIEIPNQNEKNFGYADSVRQGDVIYIFPIDLRKGIYRLHLDEHRIEKDKDLSLLFESGFQCANVFLLQDNCILMGEYGGNRIIEVSLDMKKITKVHILDERMQICSLFCDGFSYWIIQIQSLIVYEWNYQNNALRVYRNEEIGEENGANIKGAPYSNLIFLEDEILILNNELKNIWRIHRDRNLIEDPIDFPEGFQVAKYHSLSGWSICNTYTVLKDKILIYPQRGNVMLIYDLHTKRLLCKAMSISGEKIPYWDNMMKEIFSDNEVNREREELQSLDAFVYVATIKRKAVEIHETDAIGKSIYQILGGERK